MKSLKKILFVCHDANRAGAQLMLLSFVEYFHKKGYSNAVLFLDGGILEADFQQFVKVYKLPKKRVQTFGLRERIKRKFNWSKQNELEDLKVSLKNQDFDLIYANTIASSSAIAELLFLNIPIISHIHELEFSIQMYSNQIEREVLLDHSELFIACSDAVGQNLIDKHEIGLSEIKTIHSFIDNDAILSRVNSVDYQLVKHNYNLPNDALLVVSCGNAEWRKGSDIFIQIASKFKDSNIHFVWIGIKHEGDLYEKLQYDIEKLGIKSQIHLLEPTTEAAEIIAVSDIFALTSREDPFPLVMLEAALASKPIIGFDKSGGCTEFVETDAGFAVEYLNIEEFVEKIQILANNLTLRKEIGEKAKQKVLKKYNFVSSISEIEKIIKNF